jgi:hypothetical protein
MPGGEDKVIEHLAKAEYSALPQITNGEAIILTGRNHYRPASAFATGTLDPISGP